MSRDELSARSVTASLPTRYIGQNVIFRGKLSSTMDLARKEMQHGAANGTVVLAGEQTAGRGRLGRSWLSPRGNLALSIILYPQEQYLSSLVMVASLAAAQSIESHSGLNVDIKWPNDILIRGKKVCGIMIESGLAATSRCYAILGLGLNVNMRLADYSEIAATATSLSDETGKEVSRLALVRELLTQLERWYEALLCGESVYVSWRQRVITLGKAVRVQAGEMSFEGVAESVGTDGSLLLRLADGKLVAVPAGDVTLRA